MTDLVIGGAGVFGLTIAERAASSGYKVVIVEKKDKVGGNMSSHKDEETGIEVHTYGSHIFHTSNENVWKYVNRFTDFFPYIHRGRTVTRGGSVIPLPFSLATYSAYYNAHFTPRVLFEYLKNFEGYIGEDFRSVAIRSIGEDLYEEVVEGYSRKHWGRDPKDLPPSVIKRLPVRDTFDDNYFSDTYQGVPTNGYQEWLEKMADNKNITVKFNADITDYEQTYPLVYTGELDAFFNYKFGRLGWRSMDFVEERFTTDNYQGCALLNYADEQVPYTRVHEYKHYRPDKEYKGTVIHKEYPRETKMGEVGAYPVNAIQDREKLALYRNAAAELKDVWFGGRLGSYKYLDMHAAIASALTLWNNQIKPYLEEQ